MQFKTLLLAVCYVITTGHVAQSAESCSPQRSTLPKNQLVKADNFGVVGFARNPRPSRITRTDTTDCFKVKKKKRLYFWIGHKGNFEESAPTYLAVQIVKRFKKSGRLQFKFRTHGARMGKWTRDETPLKEIPKVKPFGTMTPTEFIKLHASEEFISESGKLDDRILVQKFENQFWHGSPIGMEESSLKKPDYWSGPVNSEENLQIENLLIRFTTVPKNEEANSNKDGVPFDTGTPAGLEAMEVRIFSPLSSELQHRVFLEFE